MRPISSKTKWKSELGWTSAALNTGNAHRMMINWISNWRFGVLILQPLEWSGRPQQAHWGRVPLELSQAWQREGGVLPAFWIQHHLPKSGGHVNCWEDWRSHSSNLVNAFLDISHRVLVHVRVLIDGPEVLNDSHSSILFVHNKNGAVELAPRRSHYPQFQQLFNVLLDSLVLSLRSFWFNNWSLDFVYGTVY